MGYLPIMYLLFAGSVDSMLLNTIRNNAPLDGNSPYPAGPGDPGSQHRFLDLKKDEISSYLERNGAGAGPGSRIQRRSQKFMVHVFEKLLLGTPLSEAVGHTDGRALVEVQQSDTVRCLSARESHKTGRLTFTIPDFPDHEKLKMAELRFKYRNITNLKSRSSFIIKIRHGRKTVKSIRLKPKRGRQTIFDISSEVLSFVQRFKRNISVEVRYKLKDKSLNRSTNNARFYKDQPVPVMVLYSQDKTFLQNMYKTLVSIENTDSANETNHTERSKRATDESERKRRRRRRKNKWRKNEKCQLHDFKVDFDLLGWGQWIIHPKTFNAKVCYGQCPSPITEDYTPTNHAMLQTLMKLKRPLVAPEPCCVPTKLRPLSMLYFEHDAVVVRHHQDMVAAECGCR